MSKITLENAVKVAKRELAIPLHEPTDEEMDDNPNPVNVEIEIALEDERKWRDIAAALVDRVEALETSYEQIRVTLMACSYDLDITRGGAEEAGRLLETQREMIRDLQEQSAAAVAALQDAYDDDGMPCGLAWVDACVKQALAALTDNDVKEGTT